MDELSEYSSEVIEFLPTQYEEKQSKFVESCISTDPGPSSQDKFSETTLNANIGTQTEEFSTSLDCHVDERKLADWLRKICPAVEEQLLKGPTPLNEASDSAPINLFAEQLNIKVYQKITIGAFENSQGIATWLSVHTDNAPILIASTKAPHDDWCDHLQQSLKLFIPKRMPNGNLVIFQEVKSVPLKACLSCLSTNGYNKSIFAGSTMDGDIHIWLVQSGSRRVNGSVQNDTMAGCQEIEELCCATSPQGCAVALDWLSENRLISFHGNGWIICWTIGKEMIIENDFQLKAPSAMSSTTEITAAVCLSLNTFAVGIKDGSIFLCTIPSFTTKRKQLEIISLKKHLFMITTLLKTDIGNGRRNIISCDLSGEVYCHNLTSAEEEHPDATIQIPLPFKNAIACSKDGNVIYCPGNDGSLECFNVIHGIHKIIQGALRGKGNFIACSDNGNWIITGLYQDDFQLFYVET